MLPGGAPEGGATPAFRRDQWLAFPAVSTATLLAADAWFDGRQAARRRPANRWMLAAAGISAAIAAAAARWYTDSAPYPYAQHRILGLPLPFLTSRRPDALLAIRPGERAL